MYDPWTRTKGWGNAGGWGEGARWRGDKGEKKTGTTVIAQSIKYT